MAHKLGFVVCTILVIGCTTAVEPWQRPLPQRAAELRTAASRQVEFEQFTISEIQASKLGIAASSARMGEHFYDVDELASMLKAVSPDAELHRLQASEWRRASRYGFWAGLAGMTLSFAAGGNVPMRTSGNAAWGLGWTTWLGCLAMQQAEYNDTVDSYQKSLRVRIGPSASIGVWQF